MGRSSISVRRTQGILGGRSAQVVRSVLDAAIIELAGSGYNALQMSKVAARAGVNKTTIYRRWPSRAALVRALVERMYAPLLETRLPDTGRLEDDLVEAFSRRFVTGRTVEGRAWARLLDERRHAEVGAIIGKAVEERGAEWRSMVTRAIERGEIPPGTSAQLLLDVVRAIVDGSNRSAPSQLDKAWLVLSVRTVIAGARAGTLVESRKMPSVKRQRRNSRK